jgi:hypothetical protein
VRPRPIPTSGGGCLGSERVIVLGLAHRLELCHVQCGQKTSDHLSFIGEWISVISPGKHAGRGREMGSGLEPMCDPIASACDTSIFFKFHEAETRLVSILGIGVDDVPFTSINTIYDDNHPIEMIVFI